LCSRVLNVDGDYGKSVRESGKTFSKGSILIKEIEGYLLEIEIKRGG